MYKYRVSLAKSKSDVLEPISKMQSTLKLAHYNSFLIYAGYASAGAVVGIHFHNPLRAIDNRKFSV